MFADTSQNGDGTTSKHTARNIPQSNAEM